VPVTETNWIAGTFELLGPGLVYGLVVLVPAGVGVAATRVWRRIRNPRP
jgi:hypothetical protein